MRAAATSESFEFVARAYAVNGNAVQANPRARASRRPAMRQPSIIMPAMHRRSISDAAPCAAGSESHVPVHGWTSSNGTYAR